MAADSDKVTSPYQGLESRAFWRSGVAEAGRFPPADVYRARFPITRDLPIFTAGSCFAQHVGNALRSSGFRVLDAEPLPAGMAAHFRPMAQTYGYGLYSARYGNIYTVRQFLQLIREAHGEFQPADPIWERDGRFFDALRPGTEPNGLETPELVTRARAGHLAAVRDALGQAGLVVFTLGLTESWQHTESGTVYPTAPGTIAGQMDDARYSFINFRASQIREDFLEVRDYLKAINPDIRFLLTVSPVPLTATASGNHVLPATVYSKAVLRTVAGELYEDFEDIDYFPSFEIVASHASDDGFFADNLRSVTTRGVRRVMRAFLAAHGAGQDTAEERDVADSDGTDDDVVCEEALLEAFST
ncbi:GSCFA domain-containing protein [Falsiphaeobacter marinintestinus]|uniref:GSCFA domain-containing protein n=1 Tax=Falsiphaeobacter marinintestinus TaxID=1492905 RepID=UPI0011B407A4|nr:GSCFA domain-containing protein [Phaeobacter marinintestinus]